MTANRMSFSADIFSVPQVNTANPTVNSSTAVRRASNIFKRALRLKNNKGANDSTSSNSGAYSRDSDEGPAIDITGSGVFGESTRIATRPGPSKSVSRNPLGEDVDDGGELLSSRKQSEHHLNTKSSRSNFSSVYEAEEADINGKQANTLRKIFDDADVDKSGFLGPSEVLTAMRTFGVAIDLEDVYELLMEIELSGPESCFTPMNAIAYDKASEIEKTFRIIDTSPSDDHQEVEGSPGITRVPFEDFQKLLQLWQSAARFQLFDTDRSNEAASHVQFATSRTFLVADGVPLWLWQVVMMIVASYLAIMAAAVFTTTLDERGQFFAAFTGPDAAVTIFLIADIVIKFNSCVTVERNGVTFVVDDRAGIAREYMTSVWFWIDLLTVMPLRFLCAAGGDPTYLLRVDNATDALLNARESGCVGCVTGADYEAKMIGATVLTVIRALKYVEHYRYFAETSLTPMTRWYIWRQFVVGHLLALVSNFVVCVHILSVIFLRIQHSNSADGMRGELYRYAEALYVVLYCMATVGFGDVRSTSNSILIYEMFLCVCGSLFSGFVVGSMVSFFQQSDIETDRQSQIVETLNLLDYFDVPMSLTLEILSFKNYILQNSLMKSYGSVVNELPADMQRNLELWTRIQAVNTMPVIRDGHRSAKLQICNSLLEVTFSPEEYVFLIGEIGEEMFFINHGFVDLLDAHSHLIATKKSGEYFGELAALQSGSTWRPCDAKCLTYCEFFVLCRDEFQEVLMKYPRISKAVMLYVLEKTKEVNHQLEKAIGVRFTPKSGVRKSFLKHLSSAKQSIVSDRIPSPICSDLEQQHQFIMPTFDSELAKTTSAARAHNGRADVDGGRCAEQHDLHLHAPDGITLTRLGQASSLEPGLVPPQLLSPKNPGDSDGSVIRSKLRKKSKSSTDLLDTSFVPPHLPEPRLSFLSVTGGRSPMIPRLSVSSAKSPEVRALGGESTDKVHSNNDDPILVSPAPQSVEQQPAPPVFLLSADELPNTEGELHNSVWVTAICQQVLRDSSLSMHQSLKEEISSLTKDQLQQLVEALCVQGLELSTMLKDSKDN